MFIVVAWFVLAFLVGAAGSKRNIGYGTAFFCSLIFSPIIGLLFVLLSDVKTDTPDQIDNIEKYYEAAKRFEFKGMTNEAIDSYTDTLYYMNKDIDDLGRYDAKERREEMQKINNRIRLLRQRKINDVVKT